MNARLNRLREVLDSNRQGRSRSTRYYQKVLGVGAGYPTYDEARRDLVNRDRATLYPPLPH
jgi:hypothetical protein